MDKREISLTELFQLALKWLWLLIAGMVIFGAAAFYYSRFCVTPMYSATSKCYVQTGEQSLQQSSSSQLVEEQRSIALSQLVVANYIEILDTYYFTDELNYYLAGNTRPSDSADKRARLKQAGKIEGSYTPEQLKKMITYTVKDELAVFNVKVVSTSANDAIVIAKHIELIMMDYIESINSTSGVIRVIDGAIPSNGPINNNVIVNTLLGIIAGFVITFFIVFVIDMNDTRINDEKILGDTFGLPVIGMIPDINSNNLPQLYPTYSDDV